MWKASMGRSNGLTDGVIIEDLRTQVERLQLENDGLRQRLETARQMTRAALRILNGKRSWVKEPWAFEALGKITP